MVFDGSGPLAERCYGFDGSLWSKSDSGQHSGLEKIFSSLRLKAENEISIRIMVSVNLETKCNTKKRSTPPLKNTKMCLNLILELA